MQRKGTGSMEQSSAPEAHARDGAHARGKVAFVTGGASGIGRATALLFAQRGAKVAIADVNEAGGEETVRQVEEAGGEALFLKADVSSSKEVEAAVRKVVESYGRLDWAFNNAAVRSDDHALTADYSEKEWDRIVGTNIKSVFLCMKYELRHMVERGEGVIVNTASVHGLVGAGHGINAYVASKHGVVGLTKAAALEYADQGIRINAVCPGHIETPMIEHLVNDPAWMSRTTAQYPMRRIGSAEEIAEAVLWLCSDAASFVTGHALPLEGGFLAQ